MNGDIPDTKTRAYQIVYDVVFELKTECTDRIHSESSCLLNIFL